MAQITVTMNSKNQVPIPDEVKVLLGLQPGDRLIWRIEGAEARVTVARSAATLAGAARPAYPVEDIDEAIRAAKEEKAVLEWGEMGECRAARH